MSPPSGRPDGPTDPAAPRIWGILNVTPDSFHDGGRDADAEAAVARGLELVGCGADVIDVGGESTRPGARTVPAQEEILRVVPVLEGLRASGVSAPLSVDTRKAEVAAAALDAGARIVNDVSAGLHDPDMLPLVAERGAGLVLMHMRGTPETMQDAPHYDDVVADVRAWLAARVSAAEAAGIPRDVIWIDPGIGFGKTLEHNVLLLRALDTLVADGPRVLLGASRKSFLGRLTGRDATADRLSGSLACVARAVEAGADAVRVHDVVETRDLIRVLRSIRPTGDA